jgi:hypothetical protein
MKKLMIPMIVLTAVVFTGCSSSSYPTSEPYAERAIVNDGYYPPGYYGSYYYGGGYFPPQGIYRNQYSRRRPSVVYRTPTPRVIRVNPNHPQGNWNRNDNNRNDNNRNWNRGNNNNNKNWNRSDNNNNRRSDGNRNNNRDQRNSRSRN